MADVNQRGNYAFFCETVAVQLCKLVKIFVSFHNYPINPFSNIAICSAFVFSAMSIYGFIAL